MALGAVAGADGFDGAVLVGVGHGGPGGEARPPCESVTIQCTRTTRRSSFGNRVNSSDSLGESGGPVRLDAYQDPYYSLRSSIRFALTGGLRINLAGGRAEATT